MPVSKTVRAYDLAKELKQDTRRIINDLRREGADVSVPSNTVSREIADKVRNKYFPKPETDEIPKRKKEQTLKKSASYASKEDKVFAPTYNSLQVNKRKILTVDCRECLRPTKHNLVFSIKADINEIYQIIECRGCESFSFRRTTLKNNNRLNHKEEIDLYPSRMIGRQKMSLDSFPSTIALTYEEIHLALSNKLLVLATIGMRTLIELVCNDRGSNAGNLVGKINDLLDRNLLTSKNADNLHKLRNFGNGAAHEADIQSEDKLNKCMDIIEHLLKDIYLTEISD